MTTRRRGEVGEKGRDYEALRRESRGESGDKDENLCRETGGSTRRRSRAVWRPERERA